MHQFTKRHQLLWSFVLQTPDRGSAAGPHWGTSVPRPPPVVEIQNTPLRPDDLR